jgi:hypothetical protein
MDMQPGRPAVLGQNLHHRRRHRRPCGTNGSRGLCTHGKPPHGPDLPGRLSHQSCSMRIRCRMHSFPGPGHSSRPYTQTAYNRGPKCIRKMRLKQPTQRCYRLLVSYPTIPYHSIVRMDSLELSSARQPLESRKSVNPLFSISWLQAIPPPRLYPWCKIDKLDRDCGRKDGSTESRGQYHFRYRQTRMSALLCENGAVLLRENGAVLLRENGAVLLCENGTVHFSDQRLVLW